MISRQRYHYLVTLHVSHWPGTSVAARRLVVKKRSGRDGITWDALQAIKNEVLGEDVRAIEVFPRAGELVYEINARHLWEVPDGVNVPCLYGRG